MYYRVIPFKRTFDTYGLIYSVPKILQSNIAPGKIIVVPFRDTQELALCIEEVEESKINCKIESIKDIISMQSDFIFLEKQQLELICFVAQHYITPIHHALGLYFPRNLVEKIAKNTLEKIKISDYCYKQSNITLSLEQEKIYKKIIGSTHKKHLIYGVTGSGKTQIYMKIIQDNLNIGKQTLLLIPEIILTSQIGKRVKQVFGDDVLILHSGVTQAKKSKYWMDIHCGNAKIIIGTRSSLFYPYNNLGAIIIDEEHDSSYISDQAPRYHSLDIAEKLSQLYNIPLILGSGTPRVTTFYRGLKGEFQVLQLLEKYENKEDKNKEEANKEDFKYKGKYKVESNRLQGYDYSSKGIYFITICTKDKQHFFGEIENKKVILNEVGEEVVKYWNEIPEHFGQVELVEFIIMPNHIHGIIEIKDNLVEEEYTQTKNISSLQERKTYIPTGTSQTVGSILRGFKIGATKWVRKNTEIYTLWQANYYDHIIGNEEELVRVQKYIQENPQKWNEDENNIHNEYST